MARVGPLGRVVALVVASGCLGMLVMGLLVNPDPSGVGTHHQLGLVPCGMISRYGIPCMTCGMTTSVAWFVRGRLLASVYVQPMGLAIAFLAGMTFWAALYTAISGRSAHRLLHLVPWRHYLVPLGVLAILAWIWKIAIHLAGCDGWR